MKQHPIKAIRRAAVPLCGFETADPAATIRSILKSLNGSPGAVAQWDSAVGIAPVTKNSQSMIAGLGLEAQTPLDQVLSALTKLRVEDAVVFIHNAHRYLNNEFIMQSVWNLRDAWKALGNTLVLLGPALSLPPELQQDVIIVAEEPPSPEEIDEILSAVCKAATQHGEQMASIDETKLVDATIGYLSGYAVEQSFSLALEKGADGKLYFDLDRLWQLKIQSLKATAGLEVSLPKETFNDLKGCEGYKHIVGQYIHGKEPPRAVLHLDELEKMNAGSMGDLSGTSQAILEQFLFWFEARRAKGVLCVGIPGGGKTRAGVCTAGEAQIPHLRASFSTVKGSLVGQSEQQMKTLLKQVDAIAPNGRVLVLGTCNAVDTLPPELMSRVGKLATLVFDYPTAEEAAAIWAYYRAKYGIDSPKIPKNTRDWVGREIESCCERAYLFSCSLDEAAKSVVPICVANAARMDALRANLSGRFLSAAKLEPYYFNRTDSVSGSGPVRRFNESKN